MSNSELSACPATNPIARRQSMPFLAGPNIFNHTTVGKIIRFEANDFGFICLQCGLNFRGGNRFLAHIETHYSTVAAQPTPNPSPLVTISESSESSSDDTPVAMLVPGRTSQPQPNANARKRPMQRVSMSMGAPSRQPPARKSTSARAIGCCFCARKFWAKTHLEQHKNAEHAAILRRLKSRDGAFLCSLCGEQFTKQQHAAAERHLQVMHVGKGEI